MSWEAHPRPSLPVTVVPEILTRTSAMSAEPALGDGRRDTTGIAAFANTRDGSRRARSDTGWVRPERSLARRRELFSKSPERDRGVARSPDRARALDRTNDRGRPTRRFPAHRSRP